MAKVKPRIEVRARCNVRIRTEAYDALERMVGQVVQNGWSVLGREESIERPTKEAVAAYAIQTVAERIKKRQRA